MPRISLHIEDHPAGSVAVLRVGGVDLRLTANEFDGLVQETTWARPIINQRTYQSEAAIAAYDAEATSNHLSRRTYP